MTGLSVFPRILVLMCMSHMQHVSLKVTLALLDKQSVCVASSSVLIGPHRLRAASQLLRTQVSLWNQRDLLL